MAPHCSINVQHHYVKCAPTTTDWSSPISIMDRKQKKWPFLEFKVVIWGGGEPREGMKVYLIETMKQSTEWAGAILNVCQMQLAHWQLVQRPSATSTLPQNRFQVQSSFWGECQQLFFGFCHQKSFLLSVTLRNRSSSVRGVSSVINPDVFYELSCICYVA